MIDTSILAIRRYRTIATMLLSVLYILFAAVQPVLAGCDSDTTVSLEVQIGSATTIRGLGNYISTAYLFVVGIIGIMSAVVIMYAGVRWAAAAGNSSIIGDSKERIKGAFIGLAIALGSYAILFNINPILTTIPEICPPGVEVPLQYYEEGASEWAACTSATYCNTSIEYCEQTEEQAASGTGGCSCEPVGDDDVCIPQSNEMGENEKCQSDDNCVNPYECVGATSTSPGRCQVGNSGDKCTTDADCTGTVCIDTGPESYCMKETGRNEGEFCEDDGECVSGICAESAKECVGGEEGDSCFNREDNCLSGYTCGNSSNTCEAKENGDSCDWDGDGCPSGLTCVDTYGVGGNCSDGSEESYCESNSDCSGTNRCVDETGVGTSRCFDGNEGDPCDSSNPQCASGNYCYNGWTEDVCYDGSTGDDCNTGSQCQTNICTSGKCT